MVFILVIHVNIKQILNKIKQAALALAVPLCYESFGYAQNQGIGRWGGKKYKLRITK